MPDKQTELMRLIIALRENHGSDNQDPYRFVCQGSVLIENLKTDLILDLQIIPGKKYIVTVGDWPYSSNITGIDEVKS